MDRVEANEANSAFLPSGAMGGEGGTWVDCFKKVFTGSPKIVVWTAVEEVTKLHKATKTKKKKQKELIQRPGYASFLIWGFILACFGCVTLIWTPYEVLQNERLKMVRGLPAFEWWKNPPDEVLLRMYLFNVTNSEAYMKGEATKLHVEEIGPIIYREKLRHTDVRFNDNDTMTYVAHRQAIFLPELNNISLNATIVVPNLAVLGLSSYLWNAPFVAKFGFNLLLNKYNAQPLIPVKINDYLWNLTDPVIKVARKLAPHLVPEENVGVLHQIYRNFVDEVTVHIGVKEGGRDFFKLDKYHGIDGMGAWDNETCDSVQGSTEGVTYHQEILRTDILKYLRKTLCRAADLFYTRDEELFGMTAYRFDLGNDSFASPPPETGQVNCYLKSGLPPLPSGLTDVSPCYFDFPIASSFPHFMHSDPAATERIEGMAPDPEKHGSYVVVEPRTGVPFNSRARSQSSLVVRSMSGFPRLKKFSNMAIPMFWIEYNQVGLPWYILSLMYFTVIILPITQTFFSLGLIGLSVIMIIVATRRILSRRNQPNLVSYSSLDIPQITTQKISVC